MIELDEVSDRSRCDGQDGDAAVEQVVAPCRVVGHLVDGSMVLAAVVFKRDVRVRPDQITIVAFVIDCEPRSPSRVHGVVHTRLGKRVPAHAEREAEQHGHGRFHRGGGACDEVLEGFSGFDGSRHVRGFVQEAREAGGSGEGALEPEVRFSNRCHSVCAAQLESKPDQRGKRQLRSHLHEAELGRACKHVAGDAHERSSGKHCGAHVAYGLVASAARRLARHDDVQGERDALELRHSGKLADQEFGDLAF